MARLFAVALVAGVLGLGGIATADALTTSSLPQITIPTLPVTVPTLPVTVPTLPVTLPTLPVTLPTLPTLPGVSPPSLSVTPNKAKRRTPITASGSGFSPHELVTVIYMGGMKNPVRAKTVLCKATTSLTGSFTCKGAIPKRPRSGKRGMHTIVAAGGSGTQSSTTFNLHP